MLESVLRDKDTDLIVYKLFVWISLEGSEEAHNVRILTILSIIIWRKTMTSYSLFGRSETIRKLGINRNGHSYLSKFVPRSIETTDDCSRVMGRR